MKKRTPQRSHFHHVWCLGCDFSGLVHEKNCDKPCRKCGSVLLFTIDPWDTPFFSMLPKTKASGLLHEWVIDDWPGDAVLRVQPEDSESLA